MNTGMMGIGLRMFIPSQNPSPQQVAQQQAAQSNFANLDGVLRVSARHEVNGLITDGGARGELMSAERRATIQLSEEGMRHLEISKALNDALIQIHQSGTGSDSRVQDLTRAFGMVYQQFTPAGSTSISAEGRFVAGEGFTRGEVIFYDDRYWEILQDFTHNGDQNWRPGLAHSLFRETDQAPQTQGYCPILHRVFKGMAMMSFGVDATQHLTSQRIFSWEHGNEGDYIGRHVMLNMPREAQEAWQRSQEQAEIFIKKFLQNVYTIGHEAAFNMAMAN